MAKKKNSGTKVIKREAMSKHGSRTEHNDQKPPFSKEMAERPIRGLSHAKPHGKEKKVK